MDTESRLIPASFAQQRLWFMDQLEPGKAIYNLPAGYRVIGPLDTDALEQSLNEIVRRHETFRTTFTSIDGQPMQIIAPTLKLKLQRRDLRHVSRAEREAEALRLASEETRRPFDICARPLIRATVLQLDNEESILIFVMHHIVSDGWSVEILLRELSAIYSAFLEGKPSPLVELPIQYADFAVWQRERMQEGFFDSQISYWRKQLENIPPLLHLPTDHPRPAVPSYRGARHYVLIPKDLSNDVKTLSRREGATLFMTLLAAFKVLLRRYTGQNPIVVGIPVAGRNQVEVEDLIGFFINMLVLRSELSGDPSFLEVLWRVRETSLEAYANQDLPFEKLVEELRPERHLSVAPLFQVMFQHRNVSKEPVKMAGLILEDFEFDSGVAKYDLSLDLMDKPDGLSCLFRYNLDLFDPDTIFRMSGHFTRLLEGIVKDPKGCVSNLPLLTAGETEELRRTGCGTRFVYPEDQCIHRLFEAQVERTPEAVAVIFEGREITYRELNGRANQLAHGLRELGIGPEIMVGLCVERSLDMLVGVLGILKAGGAYLPLDPEYPKSRLKYILEKTQVSLLLTQGRLMEKLPDHDCRLLFLDEEQPPWHGEREVNPRSFAGPDNLAYVIYTSGSTGSPKGVTICHRGVVNYLSYLVKTYNLGPSDTVLQLPSLSFDASVRDLIGPLTAGATVLIVDEQDAKDPAALLSKIEKHGVTCLLSLVPVMFRGLVEAWDQRASCRSVRLILASGEGLPMSICQRAKELFGERAWIVNQYGPTECTLTTTYHPVVGPVDARGICPIGSPIPNAQIYVLDNDHNLLPRGVPGELYIGGVGLARGYLRCPDLTAEKFIPNPFNEEPGARLYKTGDLARYRSDGVLEFLGRVDHQVKVRGFRVELAEVETTLRQHPAVKEAVVAARDDAQGNKRLVAYAIPGDHAGVDPAELGKFLQERLPLYMVPSAFVFMDKLPLSPNRKIDRLALPNPDDSLLQKDFTAPRTPIEEAVAEIWRDVLGIEKAGIADDFFKFGGHSLQATQIISRLRATFQVELPLRQLFDTPNIAGLTQRIETELRQTVKQTMAIQPLSRQREFPLSYAQQRLWFLEQLEPSSPAYNIPAAFRVTGPLNLDVLEQSLNEIMRRHETLRTSFSSVEGQPVQVIAPALRVTVPLVDVSSIPEIEREAEAVHLATQEARRPFDLSQAPLFRASVLRLNEAEHILLLSIHHIVSDAWSQEILMRELSTLYSAFLEGTPSPLPELPIQYVDFALWQRQWLQGEILENQLSYWKQQLNGAPSLLELPSDRRRPGVQTFQGAKQFLALPRVLTESLKALSRKEGVTLFMTLLAAFQTMLHRYTGQEDIVVGSPIANRNRREVEGLIGFFANTLALRTDLSGNPTFRELLGRVREVALGAYGHQDLPFEKLVEELNPERDLSRNPLFQVMFVQQQDFISRLEFSGLSSKPLKLEKGIARFDLTLTMIEGEEGLRAALEYNTHLFDDASMNRMLGHWQTLLEGIVAWPDKRLSELSILTEVDRHQLLVEWNSTGRDYSVGKCIHNLFEAQAERTPEACAVIFQDKFLTYLELNRRANHLAHYLQSLGVGPEVKVAICMERSLEMVIGLLGILKAGGAYVPLDPEYPKERLVFMLEDSRARVLLTEEKLLTESTRRTVICLDRDWQNITAESNENPKSGVDADNLAYLIYTSGSTGKPKGVQIAHRSLLNTFSSMQQQPGMNQQDTLLAVTTLSFDIAALELFLPLTVGARVVIASREVAADGAKLKKELSDSGATVMQATPATWRLLLEAGWSPGNHLRVQCGGESLPRELARQLMAMGLSLWNLYGPTETTIYSTIYPVESGEDSVPIGRPIGNTEIYLLDPQLSPVPVGIPAQLYIGGEGLARGYLNRPELTAEKFIPNPFSQWPGARLYKTGDLARYLPNGNIEFLGRVDHQVKILGFRIELGEIESVLGRHPAVREVVVLAREEIENPKSEIQNPKSSKRLVAYVVPRQGHTLTVHELRSFLKQKLPEYMVPSAFVFLDSLPLTPSGKVDRRALPPPDKSRPNLESRFVAPRTPVEEALAGVWAEVLGIEQIGIHDKFFDLGGHSLLATQVMSRVRAALKVELPLRYLFEVPTVAGLAERIEMVRGAGQGLAAPSIVPVSQKGTLPLSFAQQRLWFLEQLEPLSPVYNIPMAFRLTGRLHVDVLERSLNEIARRHEALRSTFRMAGGRPVQVIAPALGLGVAVVNLSHLPGLEREAEALRLSGQEARRPFYLSRGPLLRATVLRLGEEEHILQLTMHHLVSDGWSLEILFKELAVLYSAYLDGRSSPLPELPIQYADFALWQREHLQGEVLERQLRYWKGQLEGAPLLLQLPTDRPRPPVQRFHGAKQSVVISPRLAEALYALSRQEGVTLFMTLLAAFQVLLCRYTGQEDIVVGSPIANRNREEIENLIGFFANTVVLRGDLSGDPTFRELLRRVRDVCLGAYAHQDLPFEKLVEALVLERDLSRNPLFHVMFVVEEDPVSSFEVSGLSSKRLSLDRAIARFDLSFSIIEADEGLRSVLVYNTDLFHEATIDRMLAHWQVLLEGIVAGPERRISEVPILTEVERRRLLLEWNSTQRDYSINKCLHQLFEEQVERTPDNIAVVYEDQQLTYRDLNCRANQLAHHLRTLGVGPEVLVGICMQRSLEMVVGVLGILKAGGAYVPLEPDYPKERLAFMIEDSRPPVLLTQSRLLGQLPIFSRPTQSASGNSQSAIPNPTVICLDTGCEAIAQEIQDNPRSGVRPENVAYVIYTSGSTGKPKGVMIEHKSLVNYLCWVNESLIPNGLARLPVVSGLNFDASLKQLFAPLIRGSRVWALSDDVVTQPAALLQALRTEAAVGLNCVPSLWVAIVDAMDSGQARAPAENFTSLFLGGEQLTEDLIQRSLAALPHLQIWNLYGPTETTANATAARIPPEGELTIGRPIGNTRIYILDPSLNPVPIGVPGELYIGGAGLARGYLNRADLTAEKFVPNPFGTEPGCRLYRTGDLARYLPDGNIEFLGRMDHQVKIRGFRIELGEIESVLGRHPAVREVVVLAREEIENPKSEIQNPKSSKRLVAYVVPNQGEVLTVDGLRSFLKQKLPEYMVPSVFVFLERLPLTPNGKVDRRALPAPDQSRPDLGDVFVAPSTPVEEALAGIWAEVLKLERVGIHDNFFSLGGHSLKAMEVASKISSAMNVNVSVKLLFEHPSISSLAEAIDNLDSPSRRLRRQLGSRDRAIADDLPSFSAPRDSALMRIERRPLLSLFAAGKIAPVDAAAIGYLSDTLPEQTGLTRAEIIHEWYEQLPTLTAILETFLGRTAIIGLPLFASELYDSQDGLLSVLIEALEVARKLGARTVSLTGLIPSATNYGRTIDAAIGGGGDLPKITTGHANTAATVVLAIERILSEAGRNLAQERVGFLGLGSIGVATLRLMLSCLPHPREILLCDVYNKRDLLIRAQEEITNALGFRGLARIVESKQSVPAGFYDATLMVGATNVPEVIDIERVRPGTILVDDSAPHCFSVERTVERFEKHEDILFTEGGMSRSPHPIHRLRYLPRFVEKKATPHYLKSVFEHNPLHITGCVLSGLLSSRFQDLAPTVGLAEDSSCIEHYKMLCELGFQAAELHCRDFVLPTESVRNFRRRFGSV